MMKPKFDSSIYQREDVQRSVSRIEDREKRIEAGEELPHLTLWITDRGGRLFTLDSDDRLAEPATCIYSPEDGGRLFE